MSAVDKYTLLNSTKIPQVHEAGKKVGTDDFWRAILQTKTDFQKAFYQWQMEYIRPPEYLGKITPSGNALTVAQMFMSNSALKAIEKRYFDFLQVPTGTSSANSYYYTFYNCPNLEIIEDIGIGTGQPPYYLMYTFAKDTSLHTIASITVSEDTGFSNTFNECESLVTLNVYGTIGKNGFNVQWSSELTHDSLMSIINALKDYSTDTSGRKWLVTLGRRNINRLTDDELQIIKNKGWDYA